MTKEHRCLGCECRLPDGVNTCGPSCEADFLRGEVSRLREERNIAIQKFHAEVGRGRRFCEEVVKDMRGELDAILAITNAELTDPKDAHLTLVQSVAKLANGKYWAERALSSKPDPEREAMERVVEAALFAPSEIECFVSRSGRASCAERGDGKFCKRCNLVNALSALDRARGK